METHLPRQCASGLPCSASGLRVPAVIPSWIGAGRQQDCACHGPGPHIKVKSPMETKSLVFLSKQHLMPATGGWSWLPAAFPSCRHLGTVMQGGHHQQAATALSLILRAGTALIASTLAFLVDNWKGFFLQKDLPCSVACFFPVQTTPLLYAAHGATHARAICTGIKKLWPACQSLAFDCMIDYQPPN